MYYYELCKFVARSWKLIVNLGDNNRLLGKVPSDQPGEVHDDRSSGREVPEHQSVGLLQR
jgi:hypothetical protein